jgi:hypothetical protein
VQENVEPQQPAIPPSASQEAKRAYKGAQQPGVHADKLTEEMLKPFRKEKICYSRKFGGNKRSQQRLLITCKMCLTVNNSRVNSTKLQRVGNPYYGLVNTNQTFSN